MITPDQYDVVQLMFQHYIDQALVVLKRSRGWDQMSPNERQMLLIQLSLFAKNYIETNAQGSIGDEDVN